ncbi:Hypothetical predicted protein [Pelobates cultripes]|uniref:Uncharacterized protein n=1 Tax=Pelobates cultripes TaxID=61616 RepID=A0AAD1R4H0_PELCU|nr:Hypothetical predicted protein [Pelobates cultripes]
MAPTPPAGPDDTALERIREELWGLAASMATNVDLQQLTSNIQDTLKAEMARIRSKVASQASRITTLEQAAETQTIRLNAADTAVARQGDMVLVMRRHLEDLDNRGRRCNIRIHGVP